MPPTDLAGLLERAARRDCSAFAVFYDHTIDDAFYLARISAVDAVDDDVARIVQCAYLDAWIQSASFPRTGLSAGAWMMVLVRRNVRDRHPRHRHVHHRRGRLLGSRRRPSAVSPQD